MNKTVLVFSDSHGAARRMQKVIDAYEGRYDAVFFLGDGLRDAESLVIPSEKQKVFIRGNCDFDSSEPGFTKLNIGKYVFILTHGHAYGVKRGIDDYVKFARSNNADAALFGHTHVPLEACLADGEKPLYLFNPGSVSCPACGGATFGVITVTDGGILFSHGDVADLM